MIPPIFIGPEVVYNFAASTVNAIASSLAQTPNGTPDRAIVTFGQIAWDNTTCGQLALAVTQSFPAQNFPTQAQVRLNCNNALIIYQFQLELARCAPGVDEDGNAPSVEEMNTYAHGMLYDAYVMRTSLACILHSLYADNPQIIADYQIDDDMANGPLGDSAANTLNFKVAWMQDCVCGD